MRLNSVAFRYRRRDPWILREISLALPRGRVVEVTGPNGAGKSTLLRLIAGVLRPGRGSITERPAKVGYAPERFPAAQPFPVGTYLRYLARMRRMSSAEAQMAITEWAERLGLGPLLGTPLPELSKGSAHKVGLAQALLTAPELVVLDEPFAGLDPQTRSALRSLLAELADGGATVLVSDHQSALRKLPEVHRLRVDGHTVTMAGGGMEHTVIEVVVPLAEADEAVRRLRADGYAVRGTRR